MNGFRTERRDTNRDIFGALRSAVPHPFAFVSPNRLARGDFDYSAFVFDTHHAGKNHRELIEFGALPWFGPSGGAAHVRDTQPRLARIHSTDVLIHQLVSGNRNMCGTLN